MNKLSQKEYEDMQFELIGEICTQDELTNEEDNEGAHHSMYLFEWDFVTFIYDEYSNLDDFQREFWIIEDGVVRKTNFMEDNILRSFDNYDNLNSTECKIILFREVGDCEVSVMTYGEYKNE